MKKLSFKAAVASITLMGLSSMAHAAPDAQGTFVWSGVVPGSIASAALVITGLNGNATAMTGAIQPNTDGTFVSPVLVAESRTNTGSELAPVAGDLAAANWTLVDATLAYNGVTVTDAVLDVTINGVSASINDSIPSVDNLKISLAQAVPLDEASVAGSTVQASVTVIAATII
ncbi:hypothetical protein ABRZ68_12040 [Vibrio vulnificus]|uniref:hypothetical protein n=1 Tax=Vibrio vulnificus TaxID=672 RepID=UPI001A2E32D6|nr:hypothetical protein [Vibrio vulnificus]HAS6222318.1 hypothetical protein [Vibrio vulnificus]